MLSIPDPYPLDAEGFEHPHWCDPAQCTAPSMLQARGVAESDVPLTLSSAHLGTPRVIDGARIAEARYTLQPWRMIDEPVTDEVQGVDLTVELLDERLRMVLPVTPEQVPPLVAALVDVRETVRSGRPYTVVQLAVKALVDFHVTDSSTAARLLPMWARYGELTAAEVDEVVSWFVDGTDEFVGGDR